MKSASSLRTLLIALGAAACSPCAWADNPVERGVPAPLQQYFETQVARLEKGLSSEIRTKEDWLAKKDQYRRELADMLGLNPMPGRTDLKTVKTGEFEHEGIVIENLHYQSMPGLYVTANLYRPKTVDKPLPTVLYVCGHANMTKDGVRYGNKAGYEHHGVWYAKHGFVCLVIDTVELGELPGEHHGTYSKGRWWWLSRGYTPAGLEAWSGIRGLDYLESRPEVDKTRFGVTGRSGGGAYSWWIAALDERIAAAAPTAGITSLRNHVVDGCVEGHCDCMYMVNTYRWDYDKVAALVAPRALCIVNTDKDNIFPVDGVFRVYVEALRIYKLLGAEKKIGLHIAEGPHNDAQPVNVGEFHWMTRFLQGADSMSTLDTPAVHGTPIAKLKVFSEPPQGELNTKADEVFVAQAPAPKIPDEIKDWNAAREGWKKALEEKCFRGWSALPPTVTLTSESSPAASKASLSFSKTIEVEKDGVSLTVYPIHGEVDTSLYIARRAGLANRDLDLIVLNALDDAGWREFAGTYAHAFPEAFPGATKTDAKAFDQEKGMFKSFKWGMAYFCPRGVGERASDVFPMPAYEDIKGKNASERKRTQILRRYYLIGQTLNGQQTWDIRCAIRALRSVEGLQDTKLWLQGFREQAGNVLYASLFEDRIARLDLHELPHSHAQAPIYLNVLRYLDVPQAVAMASERTRVVLFDNDKAAWDYPKALSEKFDWGKEKKAGLQLRDVPKAD